MILHVFHPGGGRSWMLQDMLARLNQLQNEPFFFFARRSRGGCDGEAAPATEQSRLFSTMRPFNTSGDYDSERHGRTKALARRSLTLGFTATKPRLPTGVFMFLRLV